MYIFSYVQQAVSPKRQITGVVDNASDNLLISG